MFATTIEKLEKKNFSSPDQIREFENGRFELVTVGDVTFGRGALQPGWRWSKCVKPLVGTEFCEASHLQYQLSGRLHVEMEDGSKMDFTAGDVVSIPPGHDAWVVGNEPVVIVDISGAKNYAQKSE